MWELQPGGHDLGSGSRGLEFKSVSFRAKGS